MSAPWIVAGAVLLVAALFAVRPALRFWRHTGQRVDRLAEPRPSAGEVRRGEDPDPKRPDVLRHLRPAPPGWPSRPTDQPPD